MPWNEDDMGYNPTELFNIYVNDESGGFDMNQNSFVAFLGETFGYDDGPTAFVQDYGAYFPEFDPTMGMNAAFQQYYNETGIDLSSGDYTDDSNVFGELNFGTDTMKGSMNLNIESDYVGSIRTKFDTQGKSAKNKLDAGVRANQGTYGEKTAIGQSTQALSSGTGGGIMKSGMAQRQVRDDLLTGQRIGSTLSSAYNISVEEAMNEYQTDMGQASIDFQRVANTEVQKWYDQIMSQIGSLASEEAFGEPG